MAHCELKSDVYLFSGHLFTPKDDYRVFSVYLFFYPQTPISYPQGVPVMEEVIIPVKSL